MFAELGVSGGVQHLNLEPVHISDTAAALGSETHLCSVSQAMIPEQCQGAPFPVEGELLHRMPKLVKRMRRVCLALMKESRLPHLVEDLDQFTGRCQQLGQGRGLCSFFPSGPGALGICHLCPLSFDILNSVEQ